MDCRNCGFQNKAGDTYCKNCGQLLHAQKQEGGAIAPPRNHAKSPPSQVGKRRLGIGCLLGPIVGGGISSLVGVIVGHVSSFLYSLVGDAENSGLAILLSGVTFLMSFLLSMGFGIVAKKIGLKPR